MDSKPGGKGSPGGAYNVGEQVEVFYRASEAGGWTPFACAALGTQPPRVGATVRWLPAVVTQAFDPQQPQGGISVRFSHTVWLLYDGTMLDCTDHPDALHGKFAPAFVRRKPSRPDVSFVLVRWGGASEVDPVTDGDGGWGSIGCPVSNRYLARMLACFHEELQGRYEVLTVYITCSADLHRLQSMAPLIATQLQGRATAGLYYLWPTEWFDTGAPAFAGYVERQPFFAAMRAMEAAGVISRFPHCANLYEAIASKQWMAQWSVIPHFNVPATTSVSKAFVVANSDRAAATARESLRFIRGAAGRPADEVAEGVVKLGWSWEGTDVWKWKGVQDLARKLETALHQPGLSASYAYVQEWVDFDFEMRLFFVDAVQKDTHSVIEPLFISYNAWLSIDSDGKPREFKKLTRDAVVELFSGDGDALTAAEREGTAIAQRVLSWLRTVEAEAPPVVRMDFMVKYAGRGVPPRVVFGELGEQGSCCLSWNDGPRILWKALIRSCLEKKGKGGKSNGKGVNGQSPPRS